MKDINPTLEVLPEALHRVQLGAGGRQPHQDDVLRHLHTLRHMRRGLVQEHHIETLSRVLTERVQKDAEAVRIEARQLPPEGLACGGLHGGREPIRLLQGLDDLDRLYAVARQPPVERQVQAQTTCILAEAPHGLVGRVPPSGGDSA